MIHCLPRRPLVVFVCTMVCLLLSGCNDEGLIPSASDSNLPDTGEQQAALLQAQPYEVRIEKTQNTLLGEHEFVDISVTHGSENIWKFDLLFAYDATALSFQTATPGGIYDSCGWEYFTYRYGANGNCNGGCPSGLLRVVGIASTSGGPQPSCFLTTEPFTVTTLDFLVADNRTYECVYLPIRFFWLDCEDNGITFHDGSDVANPYSQTLAVSADVYDIEGGSSIAQDRAFPTYCGTPNICLDGDNPPVRFADFYNGGIDIVCGGEIDPSGDLNLNGTPFEISDAVLYSNYFVFGLIVFDHYETQVAASDVNADGIPLSVADLVYLLRVVTGDAPEYPLVAPVTASVCYDNSFISVSQPMGAAYVVVQGHVIPELLITGVDMKYAYDQAENVTRVLVVGFEKDAAISGTFLNAQGEILQIEMATYAGAPVMTRLTPAEFVLNQNYPEPFSSTTTISFSVPIQTTYTVTIINFLGQILDVIRGSAEPGTVSIDWNAGNNPEGSYFYRLKAGDFVETRKMVLMK